MREKRKTMQAWQRFYLCFIIQDFMHVFSFSSNKTKGFKDEDLLSFFGESKFDLGRWSVNFPKSNKELLMLANTV